MARICQLTGKRPVSGNNVSHAHNKTKRRFLPNIQNKRLWSEEQQRFIRLKITPKAMRIIDKVGLDAFLKKLKLFLYHLSFLSCTTIP